MADSTTTPSPVAGQKRSNPSGNSSAGFRAVKRRASKACQCCRARKVRCNVVEHGAPCTNCRLDEVECIVTESKRRKKNWGLKLESVNQASATITTTAEAANSTTSSASDGKSPSPTPFIALEALSDPECEAALPHFIYQAQSLRRASFASSHGSVPSLSHSLSTNSSASSGFAHRPSLNFPSFELPGFIKPTPPRIPAEDLEYLWKKGALSLPEEPLRTALLDAHFNFMHPYMPILDRKQFMDVVRTEDGSKGKVGLLLFQAVMFSGTAFVDMDILRAHGYSSRKAARKATFMKARLLYDFDHEQDRMCLIQGLLLMSYWYETPDDQKDTWHWMGVAISLSHTIGLHRNPEKSSMDPKRKKLWKRIWWSCFMRDRLVALGMRRPTRIKSDDCDVPMLTLEDFDIDTGFNEEEAVHWSSEERARQEIEAERQRKLALMCIEKAKLCVCISHVLSAQYSVLNTNQGSLTADGSTRTTMMLLPKKLEPGSVEVIECDQELEAWVSGLPADAVYQNPIRGQADEVLVLHRGLLHLIYNTTVSALHRPQVLPSTPTCPPVKRTELQDMSRRKVRQAASEITRLAEDMIEFDLVKYLPTTGVTVVLPAVIIHLLDIKSSNPVTRELSLEGFALCMQVLQRLRQTYSAADYATGFLEAAIKKAGIPVENLRKHAHRRRARYYQRQNAAINASLRLNSDSEAPSTPSLTISSGGISIPVSNAALTPPPDLEGISISVSRGEEIDETDLQLKLENFLQAPPSPLDSIPMSHEHPDHKDGGFFDHIRTTASDMPDFSMPDADCSSGSEENGIEALLSGGGPDCDPFLGHDGVPTMITMGHSSSKHHNHNHHHHGHNCGGHGGLLQQHHMNHHHMQGPSRAFELTSSWSQGGALEDMERILDGVDLTFDDVIQVLETEIN